MIRALRTKELKDIFTEVIPTLLILFTIIVYMGDFFIHYIKLNSIGGWDGDAHFAVTKHFSESIFPSVYGWIPNWNMGMPWPIGYPPGFSYIMSIVYKISPLEDMMDFKIVFILTTFLIPIVIYAYFRNRINLSRYLSTIIALVSIVFLLSPFEINKKLGLTISSTFEIGVYPQTFAALIFLIWFYFFTGGIRNSKRFFISLLLLFIIINTNVHIAQTALIIIILAFIFEVVNNLTSITKVLLTYFIYILLTFSLSAYWIIPLLNTSDYFLTRTRNGTELSIIIGELIPFLALSTLSVFYLFYKKEKEFAYKLFLLYLSGWAFIFITTFPISLILPNLPIQPHRIIPFAELIFVVISPIGVSQIVYDLLTNRNYIKKYSFIISNEIKILTIIIIISLPLFMYGREILQNYSELKIIPDEEQELISYLSSLNDGRSIIDNIEYTDSITNNGKFINPIYNYIEENYEEFCYGDLEKYENLSQPEQKEYNYFTEDHRYIGQVPISFIISSQLGIENNHETLWGVFRESSINSPYIQPVRNSYSGHLESFGVVCYLCDTYTDEVLPNQRELASDYSRDPLELQIRRASLFGVKYIAVRTPTVKCFMDNIVNKENSEIVLKTQINNWNIYEILTPTTIVESNVLPVVVYTEIKNGHRDSSSYDWHRINEEWLNNSNFNYIFVKSKEDYIDISDDLDKFDIAFIAEYKYTELKNSLSKLQDFLDRGGILFLLESDSSVVDLFRHQENVYLIPNSYNVRESMKLFNETIENYIYVNDSEMSSQNLAYSSNNNDEIKVSNITSNGLYLKYSYFPWWMSSDNSEIYLASPSLMYITNNNDELSIKFETVNKDTLLGLLISILTIMSITLYFTHRIINGKR